MSIDETNQEKGKSMKQIKGPREKAAPKTKAAKKELELDQAKLDAMYYTALADIEAAPDDKKLHRDYKIIPLSAPVGYEAELIYCRIAEDPEKPKNAKPRARARIRRTDGQYVYDSGEWKCKGAAKTEVKNAIASLFELVALRASAGVRSKLQAPRIPRQP